MKTVAATETVLMGQTINKGRRETCLGMLALPLASLHPFAWAQLKEPVFPQRAVKLVTPAGPGSSIDGLTRALIPQLTLLWKQPVFVENVAGAGGVLGMQNLIRSPADGHTLAVVASNLAVSPALSKQSPYELNRDLTYIAELASTPMVLFVNAAVPVSSLRELLDYARNKKELLYASAGNGSTGHLAAEMMRQASSIPMTHVPYKAVGQALTDTIGGQVQIFFAAPSVGMEHVKAGRLKAIAHTGTSAIGSLPALPSFAQAGITGVDILAWFGVLGPAGLPQSVSSRLTRDLLQVMETQPMRDYLALQDFQPAVLAGESFKAMVLREAERWKAMVKAGVIQAG
ncbi:MAG: tripartite tricarboxylate transporter substrate-binding protein [Pseudomonadota bacterium]